uniref:Uncharacterized protein n=1 Tax=Meloidogyne incognita TaxID=6306 RepID=A0A914LCM9_MELIC
MLKVLKTARISEVQACWKCQNLQEKVSCLSPSSASIFSPLHILYRLLHRQRQQRRLSHQC